LNPPFGLTEVQLALIVIGAVAVALLAIFGSRAWLLRKRDARRVARVTAGAADYLRNVLVPDGNGGDYHLDFVLLTSRGVVIIDMRDFVGIVFGGDQMTAWTLMSGPSRTTFVNPQAGLYDRIASVKAVIQDQQTPVEGRIVFTRRGKFPKGLPKYTLMVDSLKAEFPGGEYEAVTHFMDGWSKLKKAVTPSYMAHMR